MENQQDKIIDSKFIPEDGSHTEPSMVKNILSPMTRCIPFTRGQKANFRQFFLGSEG